MRILIAWVNRLLEAKEEDRARFAFFFRAKNLNSFIVNDLSFLVNKFSDELIQAKEKLFKS